MLVVVAGEDGKFLFCRKCNEKHVLREDIVFSSVSEKKEKEVTVIDGDESNFPVTKILCPQCETMEDAEWTMQQTRAADEPPTRFYRCKKCNMVWREYS